jgi:hypothetical protein
MVVVVFLLELGLHHGWVFSLAGDAARFMLSSLVLSWIGA